MDTDIITEAKPHTIKKFELRKNTNTRLNCNVTLNDKSNVYILSGEISTVRYTSFTSQNHDGVVFHVQ